jgi:chromosome segregation ATPase
LRSKGEEDERRIKGQERVIVEFEERLKMRDEELEVKKRESKNREEKIRELEAALQRSEEGLQRERERTSDSDAQEAQKQLQALSSQTDTLQASLVQKTKELETASSQISQLQKALQSRPAHAVSEAQLKEAFRLHEHQAQKIAQLEEALQAKTVNDALATGTDTPEWHALFTRERKVKAAQDRQIAHLMASITKLNAYHVDLERESAALKEYAALHRDTVRVLRDQLAASARAAEGWREEFAQQKAMLDGRAVAEETALAALRDEMQRAIVAYHALMPTPGRPDALEITGLARKLSALERVLQETTARVDVLKGEKLALEKAVEKVMDERQDLREEIERLKSGPLPPPRVFYDEETGEEVPIPSWDTSERLLQRGIAVADFRAKREDARRKAEAEERFAEKARAWKMDKWYPPSQRDFTASPKTSAWERWDVKRWVEEKASDAEYDEASRLGLLKERERRWRRTNEWKGRRLRSMGLRSWNVEEIGY